MSRVAQVGEKKTGLAADYVLEQLLAEGGMSVVFHGRRVHDGAQVAIKMPRLGAKGAAARLRREADVLARLRHPSIVALVDRGESAQEGGCEAINEGPFMVLELVRGEPLAHLLRRTGPMPLGSVAKLVSELAGALSTAHRQGIVHRDVNPSNVLVPRAPAEPVKLIDFGIAKVAGEPPLTQEHAVPGTLGFMAPEQQGGEETEAATDQFALAAVALSALTGAVHGKVLPGEEIIWRDLRPLVAPAVESVLRRALARRPKERYPSVAALAAAFERAAIEEAPRSLPLRWLPLVLSALVALDVGLRIHVAGFVPALRSLALEPSKTIFEAGFLPAIVALGTRAFPRTAFLREWRRARFRILAVVAALIGGSVVLTVQDAWHSVCERDAVPEDLADAELRARLIALRADPVDAVAAPVRRRLYRESLDAWRAPDCRYWRMASVRAPVGAGLTFLSVATMAFLFGQIMLRAHSSQRLPTAAADAFLAAMLLTSVWPPLRLIADRLENLGDATASHAAWPLIMALASVPVLFVALIDRRRRALAVSAWMLLVGAVLPWLVPSYMPQGFAAFIAWWSRLDPAVALGFMIALTLVLVTLSTRLAAPREPEAADATAGS